MPRLAKEFLVSEDAIRRDLRAFSCRGQVQRVLRGRASDIADGVPLEHSS